MTGGLHYFEAYLPARCDGRQSWSGDSLRGLIAGGVDGVIVKRGPFVLQLLRQIADVADRMSRHADFVVVVVDLLSRSCGEARGVNDLVDFTLERSEAAGEACLLDRD